MVIIAQHRNIVPDIRTIEILRSFLGFVSLVSFGPIRHIGNFYYFTISTFKINTLRYKFDSKLFLMIDPTFGILFKIRVFVSSLVLWLLFNTEIIE